MGRAAAAARCWAARACWTMLRWVAPPQQLGVIGGCCVCCVCWLPRVSAVAWPGGHRGCCVCCLPAGLVQGLACPPVSLPACLPVPGCLASRAAPYGWQRPTPDPWRAPSPPLPAAAADVWAAVRRRRHAAQHGIFRWRRHQLRWRRAEQYAPCMHRSGGCARVPRCHASPPTHHRLPPLVRRWRLVARAACMRSIHTLTPAAVSRCHVAPIHPETALPRPAVCPFRART